MAEIPSPKVVKSVLEPTLNTIAIENGLFFDYYPIKLGDKTGDFVQLTKLPPVIAEGFVTYNKRLYKLTYRDFFRRRLNVQSSYTAPTSATRTGAVESTNTPEPIGVVEAGDNSVQSGVGNSVELQVLEDANLAWDEQINSLLHSIDSEEEWVIENYSQP